MRKRAFVVVSGVRSFGSFAVLLASAAAVIGCQGPEPFFRFPGGFLARCQVQRQECAVRDAFSLECLQVGESILTFLGDVCYNPNVTNGAADACQAAFCTNDINAPASCQTTVMSAAQTIAGVCEPAAANVGALAVTGTDHSERCGPTFIGTFPDGRAHFACNLSPVDGSFPNPTTPGLCLDATQLSVLQQLSPPSTDVSPATDLIRIGGCVETPTTTITRSLTAGPVATASGGGSTVTVTALRGLARIGEICTPEICVLKTLDTLQVDVADMTISGVPLTALAIATATPAPLTSIGDPWGGTFLGAAAGQLTLRVSGKVNGVDMVFFAVNDGPWRVDAATSSFRIRGTLNIPGVGPNGSAVTVTADASGVPATSQTLACASETALARLFGFEDVQRWSSTQAALSLATTPLTQGCGALAVQGSGYMTINGAAFSTRGLATNAAASVDLFIPGNQPNGFWLGALQMYLTCPSANVFNQYIGQVELTGEPQGHYSTLRFPLPSATRSTLAQPLDDCAFSLALNVNATGQAWLLDNLRFTP
jgi:hypothetical protein